MSKEEIYKEAWAKWANETFITDPPLKKEDCDNEHSWIYGAMEQYAKQFIQSGIKGWVNIDCPLCKGTGQDTTITAFTGTCSFCKGSGMKMVKFYEDSETPIQSGEERLFTLAEMIECWKDGYDRCWYMTQSPLNTPKVPDQQQYFKEKFNIDLK